MFTLIFLLASTPCHAQSELEMADVSINAKSIRAHDELTYTPHKIVLEQPASDSYLGETLGKLPGVLVRNTSGFGSTTTVITSQALGSGGTAVSIDDIPVVESSGRGVNFSLFPSTLISSIEHHSPFYSSMDPTADTLPAPGGRINLRTLSAPRAGESPWVGAVTLGSGKTIQGTGAYRGGGARSDWVAGVMGYNTEGSYSFKNPTDGANNTRGNNDAVSVGALGKYRLRLDNDASLEFLDLASNSDRTNPGPLTSPTRQHQKDTFNLLGARYSAPKFFSAQDGIFAKAAGAYARTGTRGSSSSAGDGGETTDSRSYGGYGQAGYVRIAHPFGFTFATDEQADYLRKDEGAFHRNVFGLTGTLSYEAGDFRMVPLVRQELSDTFPNTTDAAMSLIYAPTANDELALSYGLQHTYPTITSVAGFQNGGFTVLPNTSLLVQRDGIVSLTYDRRDSRYTLYMNAFYDLIRNRSTFSLISPTSAQFVNSAEVAVIGYTLDGQVFPVEALALRSSLTIQRAWDRATGHEMPYKPSFEGWVSASYLIRKWLAFTAQEQFVGKRFVSSTGVDAVSPFPQTIVRLDANLGPGVAYFKVANLFDAAAFENPGFPYPGRTYWLGYTVGRGEM